MKKRHLFLKFLLFVFFLFTTIIGYAQKIQMTGKVTDDKGEVLPGASIAIVGTTKGAISDINGIFTIKDVPANARIMVASIIPTKEAIDSIYSATDTRRTTSLARKSGTAIVPITQGTTTPIINKFVDNLANSNDNQNDFHALRYSDVVLMYAEALIEIGGTTNLETALASVNAVRRPHSGLPDLTYTTQDDLRQKLRAERRRELAFEGKRYYDLIRWNIFIPTMKAHMAKEYSRPVAEYDYINQNRLLLPLPFIELVSNSNLTQNPGY
jgi:starch-binding outer membrane protein, SusD/RagB family